MGLDRSLDEEGIPHLESDVVIDAVTSSPGMLLVDPADEDVDLLVDTEKDEVARSVDPELGDLIAEEAAMHVAPEPPLDPDDAYPPDLDPEDMG